MIRMDVAMQDATACKPIPSRRRSHISEVTTLTIDHSNVTPPMVPCGKQHSVLSFKLLLLTSPLASCVTHFCPTAANDSTPSLNWNSTSSAAHNGFSLEKCRAATECSPCSHPPLSAPLFSPLVQISRHIICTICTIYAHHIHFFLFFFTCQVSARFILVMC